jgi:arylformamidase
MLRRRDTLAGLALAAALPGTALMGSARAQDAQGKPPMKKVFRDLTQEELDRAYDQRVWAANAADVIKRYTTNSAAVRAKYKFEKHAYGPSEDEYLDWYPPAKAAAAPGPVHIFVHGGAWRALTAADSAFPAPAFVENGAHYVALNFANIPKVRLPDMADQVRRAIAWVHKNAGARGADPARLFLSGHSSGGHLAGVALVTDWARYGTPETVLKAGLCVSGMYDLEAPMLSARSSYVKISREEEDALSPQRHLTRVRCPVAVAYGDGESPEFKRQAREFAAALKDQVRLGSALVEGKGMNHFEIVETLADAKGLLGALALKQMGLGG